MLEHPLPCPERQHLRTLGLGAVPQLGEERWIARQPRQSRSEIWIEAFEGMPQAFEVRDQTRAKRVAPGEGELRLLVGILAVYILDDQHPAAGLHELLTHRQKGHAMQPAPIRGTQRHRLQEAWEDQEVGAQPLERLADLPLIELEWRGEGGGAADREALAAELTSRDGDAGFRAVEAVVHRIAPRREHRERQRPGAAAELDDARAGHGAP